MWNWLSEVIVGAKTMLLGPVTRYAAENEIEWGSPAWYDERWNAMPMELRVKAVEAVRPLLNEEVILEIWSKYDEYGSHKWIHHFYDVAQEDIQKFREVGMLGPYETTISAHHGFGTAVRNTLRKAGITDDMLPLASYPNGVEYANWDDYYVQVLEAAAGQR